MSKERSELLGPMQSVCMSGFFFDLEYFRHSWQLSTSCSSWSFSPGQYTACLACSLHFVSPRWPSWICFRIASCFLFAVWQFEFLSEWGHPQWLVLWWNVQYGWRTCGIFFDVVGPSHHNCVFKEHKLIISLGSLSDFLQAIASGWELVWDLIHMKFWQFDGIFLVS